MEIRPVDARHLYALTPRSSRLTSPHSSHAIAQIPHECGRKCLQYKQAVRVATQYAPAPLLPRRALPSRCNVAVLSHAEYVLTLTAAAALRVKAELIKAAW